MKLKSYLFIVCLVIHPVIFANTAYADQVGDKAKFDKCLPKAEAGDPFCQELIGEFYVFGYGGVTQDYAKAVFWYRKAAEQGYVDAQFNLGLMFAKGEGVPQDYAQALVWYRKAAEQGDAEAQNNLAIIYYNGEGVPQNQFNAYILFSLGAVSGDSGKVNNRDLIAAKLTAAELAEAQKLVGSWKVGTKLPLR
ncbi:MAG: tetratricopeptide repeat protein [Candidatus Pacebacteria bacterium]|nr:tetratricopeptide repeat protein [Candidatus Paceibacterota bacterium]